MKKEMTTIKARLIAETFFVSYEESKKDLTVGGRTLFNIIGLKKEFERVYEQIQETIAAIAESHGGTMLENGTGYNIPEDKRQEAFNKIEEFSKEKVEIEYSPITLTEKDSVPVELLEALYDFVVFEGSE